MRAVITAAEENEIVHQRFFQSLQVYSRYNHARLIVVPCYPRKGIRPHGRRAQLSKDLLPYVVDEDLDLGRHGRLLASLGLSSRADPDEIGIRVQTAPRSVVVGHPSQNLRILMPPGHSRPRFVASSGAATNYYGRLPVPGCGALLVEDSGAALHMRQLVALDNGSFFDLGKEYSPDGVRNARAAGLVIPNLGIDLMSPAGARRFGIALGELIEETNPETMVWYDVDDIGQLARRRFGPADARLNEPFEMPDYLTALEKNAKFIDAHTPPDATPVFVLRPRSRSRRRPRRTGYVDWGVPESFLPADWSDISHISDRRIPPARTILLASFQLDAFKRGRFVGAGERIRVGWAVVGDVKSNGLCRVVSCGNPGINGRSYVVAAHCGEPAFERSIHTLCLIYPKGPCSMVTLLDGQWRASEQNIGEQNDTGDEGPLVTADT